MFPLSPIYGNSAPVSASTWRGGSASPGGAIVGLTSPEGAQPVPPPTLGCLREPGKTAERGNISAAPAWGQLCLPGLCATAEEEAQPHSQYSWKMAQVTLC